MYKVLDVKDTVRVDPTKFSMGFNESIIKSLKEKYEGTFDPGVGLILSIDEIIEVGEGKLLPEDGAVYYPIKFGLMTFEPQNHEILLGEVVDITEFGAFIRIGPMDALIHVSQIMDDYVNYDEKHDNLVGRESGKKLKNGDLVRARVISVSYSEESEIGLTMKQPGLGALKWMEEEGEETPEGEE